MLFHVQSTHKAGNSPAEMEDAHASDLSRHLFAIADGATQGSHSGPFAQSLCAEFVANAGATAPDVLVATTIPAAIARFAAWEAQYLADRKTQGRALQWFEEEVIGTGAFSTLVGVELAPTASGASFKSVAVGDRCLFVVRAGAIAESFPLTDSSQFAGAPFLVCSAPARNQQLAGHVGTLSGDLVPGDALILCTDALAAWTMRERERGENPVPTLAALAAGAEPRTLVQFLAELRQDKRIRNDDVTLAYVQLEG
jgi:hypothetical protein